jgi:3-(3-hydroxy-phenyl)propionate hydroxylase
LLDAIAGSGWRFVMRDVSDAVAFDLSQRAARLGVTPVRFGRGGLMERDGVLGQWFEGAGASAALVRPDHYTFGVAADAASGADLLAFYAKARASGAQVRGA